MQHLHGSMPTGLLRNLLGCAETVRLACVATLRVTYRPTHPRSLIFRCEVFTSFGSIHQLPPFCLALMIFDVNLGCGTDKHRSARLTSPSIIKSLARFVQDDRIHPSYAILRNMCARYQFPRGFDPPAIYTPAHFIYQTLVTATSTVGFTDWPTFYTVSLAIVSEFIYAYLF